MSNRETKIPECPKHIAHPQSVWFETHWRPAIQKLQLENNVLKEQLKLAESQIDDLKQQVDELNKAVYQENGED